jgi:sugar-phosphatase
MTEHSRAIIFDMDGVLIDSEPLWRQTEIEVFASVGLELVDADCYQTTGLRIDEVVAYWFERAPWTGTPPERVAETIVDRMVEVISDEAEPMAGVHESIAAAHAERWRIGLASSSSTRLIEAVLDRFDLRDAFECRCSAENEARGKPHPDVYISALRAMGLDSADGIAIEDSAHGVASALAAGLRCVAIPPLETRDDPRFEAADWRLDSLEEFSRILPAIGTTRNQ